MPTLTIKILLTLFGLGVIIKNSAYFCWLWQLKEYRWDRLKSSLRERPSRVWFQNLGWLKLILLFVLLASLKTKLKFPLIYFQGGLILILGLELFQGVKAARERQFKKPQFTLKGAILFLLTAGSALVIWLLLGAGDIFFSLPWVGAFLVGERLISTLNLFWLLLLKPPTYFYKQYLFYKAKQKVDSASNLVRVGITGSYGKSTTKEILSQILASEYKVLKTPENVNSAIGIAETILKKLKPNHDIFVCEMGAYEKGEIELSAQIVQPQIGIITGITSQHEALFGSLENIKKAKYELIEALPKNGLAFFNGEKKHCRDLKEQTKNKESHLYGTKDSFSFKAQEIKLNPKGSTFVFSVFNAKKEIELNLIGAPSVENFIGAASCAYKIGIDLDTIAKSAKNLKTSLSSLALKKGARGATVIDDSYSANPEGVKAACQYLQQAFPEKEKIIVLRTLIELGSKAKQIHKDLGKTLAESADEVYLSSSEFAETTKKAALRAGLAEEKINIITAPKKLVQKLKEKLDSKQVILIEGRVNKVVSDYLLAK